MDKAILIGLLNDVENLGLKLSAKSFACGVQTTKETTEEMRNADAEFSALLTDLRKCIISEGV